MQDRSSKSSISRCRDRRSDVLQQLKKHYKDLGSRLTMMSSQLQIVEITAILCSYRLNINKYQI